MLFVVAGIAASAPSSATAQLPSTRPTLNVVVLGDSYSVGNGARNANGDSAYYGPSGCYRSDYSWNGLFVNSNHGSTANRAVA